MAPMAPLSHNRLTCYQCFLIFDNDSGIKPLDGNNFCAKECQDFYLITSDFDCMKCNETYPKKYGVCENGTWICLNCSPNVN